MKIVDIQTFRVRPRWLFLRIQTDEGIVGWASPEPRRASARWKRPSANCGTSSWVRILSQSSGFWQTLTAISDDYGGPILSSAVAGVDQALWDVAGKARGVPIYELLGGSGPANRVASTPGSDPSVPAIAPRRRLPPRRRPRRQRASPRQDECELRAAPYRPAGAGRRDRRARRCCARSARTRTRLRDRLPRASLESDGQTPLPLLEPYQPLFVEEPVLTEYGEAYPELVRTTSVPIAAGERLYDRAAFQPFLEAGIAIAQPDPSHAGGISELRRIASAAETYDILIAPHSAIGPLALAACLQLDFAMPNALIQEQGIGYTEAGLESKGSDILDYLLDTSVFDIAEGRIQRPLGPGLGIAIDEDAVARAAELGHEWKFRPWFHEDGSYAER